MSGANEKLGIVIDLNFDNIKDNKSNLKKAIKELKREVSKDKEFNIDVGINFGNLSKDMKELSNVINNTEKKVQNSFKNIDTKKLNNLLSTLKEINSLNKNFDIKLNTKTDKLNINNITKNLKEQQNILNKNLSNFSFEGNTGKIVTNKINGQVSKIQQQIQKDILTSIKKTWSIDLNKPMTEVVTENFNKVQKDLYNNLKKNSIDISNLEKKISLENSNGVDTSNLGKNLLLLNEKKNALENIIKTYKLENKEKEKELELTRKILENNNNHETTKYNIDKYNKQQKDLLIDSKKLAKEKKNLESKVLKSSSPNVANKYEEELQRVNEKLKNNISNLTEENKKQLDSFLNKCNIDLEQLENKINNKNEKNLLSQAKALLNEQFQLQSTILQKGENNCQEALNRLEKIKDKYNLIHSQLRENSQKKLQDLNESKYANLNAKENVVRENKIAEAYRVMEDLLRRNLDIENAIAKASSSEIHYKEQLNKELQENNILIEKQASLMEKHGLTSLEKDIEVINRLGNKLSEVDRLYAKNSDIIDSNKNKIGELRNRLNELNETYDKLNNNHINNLHSRLNFAEDIKDIEKQSLAVKNLEKEINNLNKKQHQETSTKKEGAFSSIKDYAKFTVTNFATDKIMDSIYSGFESIKEIDEAFTELKKVSNDSIDVLNNYKSVANKVAIEVGHSTSSTIVATAESIKVGFSKLSEAKEIAKQTMIYSNVGDITPEQASKSLLSIMKGYEISQPLAKIKAYGKEMTNLQRIMDLLNYTGNNFAITSGGIGDALQRSASSLHNAGNTLEQSVGLITAGNASIQDPAKVGTALKTISMRLSGMKIDKETGELIPDIGQKLHDLGVDITTLKNGKPAFKSTYEIMCLLKEKWGTWSEQVQDFVGELVAGKNHGNVFQSMITNLSDSMKLVNESQKENSEIADSAMQEQMLYMDSLRGKINALKETTVGFWEKIINTESVKQGIGLLTDFVKLLEKIVDKVGLIPTIMGGLSVFGSIKSKGNFGIGSFLDFNNVILETAEKTLANKNIVNSNTMGYVRKEMERCNKEGVKFQGISKTIAEGMATGSIESTKFARATSEVNKSLIGTALKTGASTMAIATLNGVLGMGLGVAVDLGIKAIDNWIRRQEIFAQEVKEKRDKINKDLEDTKNSIKNLNDFKESEKGNYLIDLDNRKNNLNSAELEDYKRLLKELGQLAPEVVQYTDVEGTPFINLSKGLDGVIEKYKTVLQQQESLKVSQSSDVLKTIFDDKNKIDNSNEKSDVIISKKNFEVGQIIDTPHLNDIYDNETSRKQILDKFNSLMINIQEAWETQKENFQKIRQQKQKILDDIINPKISYEEAYNNLDSNLGSKLNSLFGNLNLSAFNDEKQAMDTINKLINTMENSSKQVDFTNLIDQFNALNESFIKGEITPSSYTESIEKITDSLSSLTGVDYSLLKDLASINFDNQSLGALGEYLAIFGVNINDTSGKLQELKNNFTIVQSCIENFLKSGSWTEDQLKKIFEINPEMVTLFGSNLEEAIKNGVTNATTGLNILEYLMGNYDVSGLTERTNNEFIRIGKANQQAYAEAFKEAGSLKVSVEADEQKNTTEGIKSMNFFTIGANQEKLPIKYIMSDDGRSFDNGIHNAVKHNSGSDSIPNPKKSVEANQGASYNNGQRNGSSFIQGFKSMFGGIGDWISRHTSGGSTVGGDDKTRLARNLLSRATELGEFLDEDTGLIDTSSCYVNESATVEGKVLYSNKIETEYNGFGNEQQQNNLIANVSNTTEGQSLNSGSFITSGVFIPSAIKPSRGGRNSSKKRISSVKERKHKEKVRKEKKKEIADLKLEIDLQVRLKNALEDVNNQLAYNKVLKEQNNSGERRVQLLQEEIMLIQNKQEAIENLRQGMLAEQRDIRSVLEEKGFAFDEKGNITNEVVNLQAKQDWANSLSEEDKKYAIEVVKQLQKEVKRYNELAHREIPKQVEEWKSLENAIKKNYETMLNSVKTAEDKVTNILKKQIEERKKIIDKEAKDTIEAYRKVQQGISKQRENDEYNEKLKEEYDKLYEIQEKINDSKLDNSSTNVNRVNGLLEKYNKQKKEIEKMIKNHTEKEDDEALNKEIENIEKQAEQKKQALDDTWTTEKIQEAVDKAIISGQFVNIGNGNITSLKDTWIEFANEFEGGLSAIGQKLKNDFINNLDEAKSILSDIKELNASLGYSETSNDLPKWTERNYRLNPIPLGLKGTNIDTVCKKEDIGIVFKSPLLNIEGNVTRDMLPDIQQITKVVQDKVTGEINKTLYKKGVV